MSTSSDTSRTATVLLVPTTQYEALRGVAERWVRAWLLDPVLLVRTGAAAVSTERGDNVPSIEAEKVTRESVRPVPDLVGWLGSGTGEGALDLVRVVDLALPEKFAGSAPEDLREEAATIAAALQRAANRSKIHRVALIVLPSDHVTDPSGLRQPAWPVNVLAAPENRRGPGGWEGFVRANDTAALTRFMLAHAATVGGLWSGMRSGSYDDLDRGTESHVDVQRISVRAVLLGDRRIRASLAAASIVTSTETDHVGTGRLRLKAHDGAMLGLLDDLQQEEVIGELLRRLLDEVPDRPLRTRLPDGPLLPAQPSPSLLERLRHLARDVGAIGPELIRMRPPLPRRWRAAAPDAPPDIVDQEIERLSELLDVDRRRIEREIGRCKRLPSGLLLAPWNRALKGRDERDHAAGVWTMLYDGTSLLLDGGVRPAAQELSRWMRVRTIEGVLAGVNAIVPDRRDVWEAPSELHSLLGLDPYIVPPRVRATDLVGMRVWRIELDEILPFADQVLASGVSEDGLDVHMAGNVVRAADELDERIERLEGTVVGRLLSAVEDEFGRFTKVFLSTFDEILAAERPRVPDAPIALGESLRAAVLPTLVVLLVLGTAGRLGSWDSAAVGLGVIVTLGAVSLALGRARVRSARLRALARWTRQVGHLRDATEKLLTEWRRSVYVQEDIEGMVELLSHLGHHGIEIVAPESSTPEELGPEDVPLAVRLAAPIERDIDGLHTERPELGRPIMICLERLLVAGWRSQAQDRLLQELGRAEPTLLRGTPPAEAIDRRPGTARDLLQRLEDGEGRYERTVGDDLLRRGVRALEGSLDPDGATDRELSQRGMPGAPNSLVRVLTPASPSSDTRRDALARSLSPGQNWDEFLLEGVGSVEPFNSSLYTDRALDGKVSAIPMTQVHGPARLERRAGIDADGVEYIRLRDDLVGKVEVMVRVDSKPDPTDLSNLKAFDVQLSEFD